MLTPEELAAGSKLRARAAALALLLLGTGCGGSDPAAPAAGRGGGATPPSILLISIDTLRPDHLGLYGYERDTSPYLDRLAAECLVFDRAYTTQPWTLVAHMSMLTGLEPEDHGVTSATRALSPEVPTVAERLRESSYRTLGFRAGECAWLDPRYGFNRGFERYVDHKGPADAEALITRELDGLNADRPLFLFLHLFDVHSALFQEGFTGFYDPPPPHDTAFLPEARERLAHVDCRQTWAGRAPLKPEELEAMVALYDGGVRYVDSALERIVEGWRTRGLLERSLLIITADHGEGLGDHGHFNGHGGMYEEGLRIPLLMRFPDGYRAGEREQGLVSLIDLAPTVLAEAGVEIEPWRAGRQLRLGPGPERIVRASRALVSARWKALVQGDHREIYDLTQDGEEVAPFSEANPEAGSRGREMQRLYKEERAARAKVPGSSIDVGALGEADAAELRDLGYADVVDK
jgi:arylsulfatase A-like enzyme